MAAFSDSEPPSLDLPLSGLRVACFESRRSAESSRMIARQGGEPVEAPTLREVPLTGALGIEQLLADLTIGAPVLIVLLTGVGAELLIEGLALKTSRAAALSLLSAETTALVCRGPKPHAVLKPLGLRPALVVGEPNTWRDVIREVTASALATGRVVYVQEYGRTNDELVDGLMVSGAKAVHPVKTYVWALPEDLEPLRRTIKLIGGGQIDVALFTSGVQVTHLLQIAAELGEGERLRSGLASTVIASVGPLTSEALRAAGISPDIEPLHPKLGHLMVRLGAEAKAKLHEKRGGVKDS